MPDALASESPLARFARMKHSSPQLTYGLSVYERPLLGYLNLRGDLSDAGFAHAVAGVLGMPPSIANTFTLAEGATIRWLGPDEWLVVMPGERAVDAVRALQHEFVGSFASVTDVSGGQTSIVLRGRGAREVCSRRAVRSTSTRARSARIAARKVTSRKRRC